MCLVASRARSCHRIRRPLIDVVELAESAALAAQRVQTHALSERLDIDLVRDGRAREIFREYFLLMEPWGLASDETHAALRQRLDAGEDVRRREARRWLDDELRGLSPFVIDGDTIRVSSTFLCLGEYLLTRPLDHDESFQSARHAINALAGHNLSRLLDRISALAGIPPFVKEVLEHYSRRLELPGVVRAA